MGMRILAATMLSVIALATSPTRAAVGQDAQTGNHVMNPAEPARSVDELQVEEIWRCGEDEEGILFGLISDVVTDDSGNLYVLDSQMNEVKVLSPEGDLLRTIGRKGEGPGEFSNGFSLAILPDGSIGVAQTYPGKLVGLRRNGDPRPDISIVGSEGAGPPLLNRIRAGGINLVVSTAGLHVATDGRQVTFDVRIAAMDDTGHLGRVFHEDTVTLTPGGRFPERDFRRVERPFDVTGDGGVAVVPDPEGYRFDVYDDRGEPVLSVEREPENWSRTERAKYFALTDMRVMGRGLGLADIELEEKEQEIVDLQCREDGSFWVQTGKATYWHARNTFWYDVFTNDGIYDRQVQVALEGDPNLDLVRFVGGDRVILIRGFRDSYHGLQGIKRPWADQEPIVAPGLICYRIIE